MAHLDDGTELDNLGGGDMYASDSSNADDYATKTSNDEPLPLSEVKVEGKGKVFITLLPGQAGKGAGVLWDRDLDDDIKRLKSGGVTVLVSLVGKSDYAKYLIKDLPKEIEKAGIELMQFGIKKDDKCDFNKVKTFCTKVSQRLQDGGKIAICGRYPRDTAMFTTCFLQVACQMRRDPSLAACQKACSVFPLTYTFKHWNKEWIDHFSKRMEWGGQKILPSKSSAAGKDSLKKYGGVETLISNLKSDDEDLVDDASSMAVKFAQDDRNKGPLGAAIPTFIDLLTYPEYDVQENMVQALKYVCMLEANKTDFRVANGFVAIIKVLKEHPDDTITMYAVQTIGFLLNRNVDNADEFMRHGGVTPLLEVLKSQDDHLLESASGAVWTFCSQGDESERFQKATGEAPNIKNLVELLKHSSDKISYQAAGAVSNIAFKNASNQEALTKAGAVERLLSELQSNSRSEDTQHTLIVGLYVVTLDSTPAHESLIAKGGVSIVLDSIKHSPSRSQTYLLSTIRSVAQSGESFRSKIVAANGFPFLMEMLQVSRDEVQIAVATALWAVTVDNDKSSRIRPARQDLESLLRLMDERNEKLTMNILAVIANLARNQNANQETLTGLGAVATITAFLRSRSPRLMDFGSRALAALMEGNEKTADNVLRERTVLPRLVKMLSLRDRSVGQFAMGAIRTLLRNNEAGIQSVLDHPHAIEHILFLLGATSAENSSTRTRIHATVIVRMIADKGKAEQNRLRDKGVVAVLGNCFYSRNVTLLQQVALAIRSLCQNNSHMQEMFLMDGIIPVMCKLLESPSAPVRIAMCVAIAAVCDDNGSARSEANDKIPNNVLNDMRNSSVEKLAAAAQHMASALDRR